MTPDGPLTIADSDIHLEWMIGDGPGHHPTTPVRARLGHAAGQHGLIDAAGVVSVLHAGADITVGAIEGGQR